MSKPKTTKKKTAAMTGKKPTEETPPEELCVFAFRLNPQERTDIHAAARSGKTSRFVRTVAVAAARNHEAAVKRRGRGSPVPGPGVPHNPNGAKPSTPDGWIRNGDITSYDPVGSCPAGHVSLYCWWT